MGRYHKRCLNPNASNYHKYGGRGIQVCDRWRHSFPNFLNDIGYAPGLEYSIDRIDNNGHYEPNNVKWSTLKEQSQNTRQNVRYDYNGQSLTLGEWAKITGIKRQTLSQRIHGLGWSIEEALTTPLHTHLKCSK